NSYCIYFFFASRRRHTRFSRDWSSDVCSSDLVLRRAAHAHNLQGAGASLVLPKSRGKRNASNVTGLAAVRPPAGRRGGGRAKLRSEERCVGRESKSWDWVLRSRQSVHQPAGAA